MAAFRTRLRVERKGFGSEAAAKDHTDRQGRFRCCRQQLRFKLVSARHPARILGCAETLLVDGVSVMAVAHHLPHGLTLPDRFDVDLDSPDDRQGA